ncbi:MAG: prealbumin-like fold domain-containing protein [Ruminococcus callidus]|nr:prealbumin-like fold domain-containing protein [Ruminococcus callidus]
MLLKQNKLKNRLLSGFLAVLIATTSVVPSNITIANAEGVSTTTEATASTAPTNAPAATESASTKDAEATTAQDSSIEKSGTKITTKTELISTDEVQSNSDNSKVEIAKNYTQPSLGLLKIDGNVISSGCVGYFGTYNRTANWSQVMHHYYIWDSANAAKNYCFCTEPELKNGKDRVYKLKENSTKKTGKADNGLSSTNILARFGHYYTKNPSNYRYKVVQAVEWTYANRTDSKFLDQVKTALGNVGITGDKRKNLIDTITSSSYDSIDVPYALYENSGAKRQKMRVWGKTLSSGQAEFDTFSKNYKYRSRILIEKHDQFGHWLGGVKFRVSIPFRYSENDLDVIGRSDIRGAEKFIEDESKLEEDENAAGTMDDKFRVNSPNDKDSEYTPWHYSVELITRDKRQSLKGKAGMYATYIGTTNSYAYLESLKYESTDITNLALSNLDQVIPDPYASAKWSYDNDPVHITKGTTTWRQLIKKLYNKWNEADNEDDDADNSCINKAPGWSKDGAEKQVDKDIQNALDDDQIKKRYRIEELGFAFGEKYTYIDPDTDEQSQRTVDVAQCLPDGITSADAIIMNPGIKEQEVSLGADNTWIKEIGADIHWIDLEPKWDYEKVYHFDAMNPRKQLSVGIQKKAMWNSNIPLANAEYTVYTNENCTNMAKDINGNVIKLTTNANGLGFAKFIPSKSTADSAITNGKTWNDMDAEYTFYVKETKAAEYTEINTSVYKTTVDYDGLGGANDPFTHTEGCYTATDKDCAGTNHTHYYKNFICTDDGSSFMKLLTTAGSWMSVGSDGLYKDNKVAYETTYTKIDMKKIDGNISAKYDLPISGATFTFYDQNQITKNADGTYVLKENATPITYSKPWYANNGKNDGKTVTITTGTGNSQSDKLYITPSMITEGYNNTQDKLNGTKLTLYAVETSVSKNGIAKWYDCPGKSVVYELSGLLNANPAENVLTPQSFCIVDKNGNAKLTKFKKGNNNGDAISDYAHLQLSISKKDAALLRKTGDDLWINGAKYGVFADKDCKKSVTYNYPSYIGDGDDYEGYAIETGTDGSKPRVPQVAGAKYTWVSDRNNNVVMTTQTAI